MIRILCSREYILSEGRVRVSQLLFMMRRRETHHACGGCHRASHQRSEGRAKVPERGSWEWHPRLQLSSYVSTTVMLAIVKIVVNIIQ